MYIDHTPHLQDRWAAKNPVNREFRCSRCGKRWQAAPGWLPSARECEECRSKTSSLDPARSNRGWIA